MHIFVDSKRALTIESNRQSVTIFTSQDPERPVCTQVPYQVMDLSLMYVCVVFENAEEVR